MVKLDRLAPSTRHLTQLAAELEALGGDLIVVDQGIDTSTPAGRLLFNRPRCGRFWRRASTGSER